MITIFNYMSNISSTLQESVQRKFATPINYYASFINNISLVYLRNTNYMQWLID